MNSRGVREKWEGKSSIATCLAYILRNGNIQKHAYLNLSQLVEKSSNIVDAEYNTFKVVLCFLRPALSIIMFIGFSLTLFLISDYSLILCLVDPPVVKNLSHLQGIVEGSNVSVPCQVIPGNPNLTYVFWNMEGNPGFQQNGTILQLLFIKKTSSGTYICNAENNYNNTEKGRHHQSTTINVLCKLKQNISYN